MPSQSIQLIAGFGSSLIFILSNLPMLHKAFKTHNLKSYSLAHIGMANLGNLLHWLYVAALPVGPVWLLHGFNTLVAVLMLFGYLHYEMRLFSKRAPVQVEQRREAAWPARRPLVRF